MSEVESLRAEIARLSDENARLKSKLDAWHEKWAEIQLSDVVKARDAVHASERREWAEEIARLTDAHASDRRARAWEIARLRKIIDDNPTITERVRRRVRKRV